MPKMSEDRLASIIEQELSQALGADGGELSKERQQALSHYLGEPLGNEVEGRSQVVMRTVMETVEWVLPALLEIFAASDKIGEYEAQGTDNPQLLALREDAAEQATDYTTHIFYKDNPGFIILHDWFKDALLQKNGWIKVFWNTETTFQTKSYTGLTYEQYQALLQGDGNETVEVVEQTSRPMPMQPMMGAPPVA